jgi:hypothetical protein
VTIELDDYDRQILRDCPFRIDTRKGRTPTRIEAARMVRIKRMWQAGYVRGEVAGDGGSLSVTIRDPGRLAIGRPAIETAATEATDAPAA